ncbi:MAG: general stress protein [Sporomusaceae bacterium]|nr:general stress protein [Sporomusaceae bacterium]
MENNNNSAQMDAQAGIVQNSYSTGQTQPQTQATGMNNSTAQDSGGMQNSMNAQAGMSAQPAMSTAQASGQQANAAGGQKVVIGVFQSRSEAEQAVSQLRSQGFSDQEINIVSKQGKQGQNQTEYAEDDISDGALTGGTLGGIGGLLLSAGALAIPGLGPIVAAGPIAAALSGAVMGGIAGGLIDWGIPEEVSRRYENSVKQGGILAVIRTSAGSVNQAASILRQNGAKDVEAHTGKAQ